MKTTHSWKWLVPRFISRNLRTSPAGKAATGRPCLALERLEDRNLLSATATGIVVEPPPTSGDTQVLIGLLQGGLTVTADEFKLLKACAGGKHIDKLVVECRQLNGDLVKIGQDLIKGELTDKKLMTAEAKIDFLKIKLTDVIISSVDAQTQKTALPILDSLFADAASLVQGLTSVEGAGVGTHEQTGEFIKLSADFLKIDDLLIKGELSLVRKAGKDQQEFIALEAKIEGVFQKANEAIVKLGESTASSLLPAVQDFENGIMNLLGSLSGGGNFEGGIVLPPTDDVIT